MNLGLGARSSGNRSLGESQSDFFFLAVQATADHLARTLSATAVKRLVDYNWGRAAALSRAHRLQPARAQLRPGARHCWRAWRRPASSRPSPNSRSTSPGSWDCRSRRTVSVVSGQLSEEEGLEAGD